jgi:replicative DNA helicase
MEVDPDLSAAHLKHLHLSDDVYTIEQVYAGASRLASKQKLHFIGVDYADCLVADKEQSEAVMGRIYHRLSVLAKKLRIPLLLVAQYRRIDGNIPTIEDIRYSGRAEQAASLILLLHNPDAAWTRSRMRAVENPIDYIEGTAAIIVGKMRYVAKNKKKGIGFIRVPWDDDHGRWGTKDMGYTSLKGQV